jgi:hypothetical protein
MIPRDDDDRFGVVDRPAWADPEYKRLQAEFDAEQEADPLVKAQLDKWRAAFIDASRRVAVLNAENQRLRAVLSLCGASTFGCSEGCGNNIECAICHRDTESRKNPETGEWEERQMHDADCALAKATGWPSCALAAALKPVLHTEEEK